MRSVGLGVRLPRRESTRGRCAFRVNNHHQHCSCCLQKAAAPKVKKTPTKKAAPKKAAAPKVKKTPTKKKTPAKKPASAKKTPASKKKA